MNRRILTALLAACLISGGCTYLLARKLQLTMSLQSRAMVRYVAPSHPLEAGAVVKASDLEWADWPAADPLRGALQQSNVAVGRVLLYPIEKGQPILDRDLSAPGTGVGLESRIPEGMRAVALRSDEVVGVGGFLEPDSRVDVLVTYHVAQAKEAITSTVLQNARVLAAGQQIEPDPQGKPTQATVVTLLLTPIEAERAVAASTQGAIHFVLRNVLDKAQVETEPVSLAGLTAGAASPADETPPPPAPLPARQPVVHEPKTGSGVETIFGGEGGGGEGGEAGSGDGAGEVGRKQSLSTPPPSPARPGVQEASGSSLVARSQP